jgi:signal transduction histidine kinase
LSVLGDLIYDSRILVVDDNPANVALLEAILDSAGYRDVQGLTDPRGVLGRFVEREHDLVLLDIQMPHLDGFAVMRQLSAVHRDDYLPVIVLTAFGDLDTRLRALEAGARDFITKPFDTREVLRRIENMLEARLLLREKRAQASVLEELVAERTRQLRELNQTLEERVRQRTAELEHLNRELESFSYTVSHDLRAPLRAINGFAALLRDELQAGSIPNSQEYLQRILSAGERMRQLIDDLLMLAQLDRKAIQRKPVDLSAIAREVGAALAAAHPQRSLRLAVEPDLKAHCDPQLMRIVLENLLGNAWKYSSGREDAVVEFGAEGLGAERAFYVRDNGAGFDLAYASKLFQPFQRFHSAKAYEGTGVGLATVHTIIVRHGGRIWAESAPDKGTTMRFSLPEP